MARSSNVAVRDLGWRGIKTNVRQLHGRGVKVGLLAGSGTNDGVAVVDIAAMLEFGTDRMPSRPFMRHTADTSERQVSAMAKRVAGGVVTGRLNVDGALNTLGLWYQDRIQSTIRAARSWAVPLAPSTVRRKGSTQPLIDKGVLIRSISYEVE